MVYVGFVHNNEVKRYGRQLVDNMFCMLAFGIPLVMSLNGLLTSMHHMSYNIPHADVCYGIQPHNYGPTCMFDDDLLHQIYGNWRNVAKTCLQISCWVDIAYIAIFASNVPEIVLYILIYLNLKRYVSLK